MTWQSTVTLAILGAAVVLFVTEWLRMDLVALLVLAALGVAGLVTPAEALSGFSNAAVVTVWAMFIISAGLGRTGVAGAVGRQMQRLAGRSEVGLVLVIMLTAAVLSGFMNNTGVAALLLPVVMQIARRTGRPPSRLLMPLAIGCLLGGLTTLIGTPPNILASEALAASGLQPFELFDFTPVGAAVTLAGILFVILIGRRLLPTRDVANELGRPQRIDLGQVYDLEDRLSIVHLPPDSALDGRTLAESRLGALLELSVITITRNGHREPLPGHDFVLHAGDRLLVAGRLDRLREIQAQEQFVVDTEGVHVEDLVTSEVGIAEMAVSSHSPILGKTLQQIRFRQRFGVNVLAILRGDTPRRTNLQDLPLQTGDVLLIHGPRIHLDALHSEPDLMVSTPQVTEVYRLHERLLILNVPPDSTLTGKTLTESRLGEVFGMTVVGIIRSDRTRFLPEADTRIEAGDKLLVEGNIENVRALGELRELDPEPRATPGLDYLVSQRVGVVEAVLSPHTTSVGKTLLELDFRHKHGLNVLAILREGRAFRSKLREIKLRFGDALLVHGPYNRLAALARDPEFLVLAEAIQEPPNSRRAPFAVLTLLGVVLSVLLGWLPISIAAVAGAALMLLTGCLSMEEAYRAIDWRAVFLIAGMLPLGIALEKSGVAGLLTDAVASLARGSGPTVLAAGFFLVTNLASQFMPNTVTTVLMAPIVVNAAAGLGLSPYALMMVVALGASASFMSPVAHPVNALVMGPGGYRFRDYIRTGLPLTILTLLIVVFVLPLIWPL